jgi:ATP-dependent DNA ligase
VSDTFPATAAAWHAAIDLGFEGTVLKKPNSLYRPGRQSSWRQLKARHTATAVLRSIRRTRDGLLLATCELNGRRVTAAAGADARAQLDQTVSVIYSRVGADGTQREARLANGNRRPQDPAARRVARGTFGQA